jgi:hypothetical protein
MGRLKKYLSIEEKRESKRLIANKYYWDNKEKCDAQQKQRDKQKRNNKNISSD